MKQGDIVWTRVGTAGAVVESFRMLGLVKVRWPWGVAMAQWGDVLRDPPAIAATAESVLREENAAHRDEVRRAMANVRDACATACAEVLAEAQASGVGTIGAGARACLDAITALDPGRL